MKPKEFDGLVRQKFDQNDFAYNPENWDKLAEKLEGKEKKRNMIVWWWAPLAGMAASVALALGVSSVLREGVPGNTGTSIAHVQQGKASPSYTTQSNSLFYTPEAQNEIAANNASDADRDDKNYVASVKNTPVRAHKTRKRIAVNTNDDASETNGGFRIHMKNTNANTIVWHAKPADILTKTIETKKNKQIALNDAFGTFKQEEEVTVKRSPRLSVILSGGVNRGNQNNGYMAGATIRKMINDKVYIEGDVAFASSNNTQSTAYMEKEVIAPVATATRTISTGKTAATEFNKNPLPPTTRDVIKQKDVSYDLYYAQVTPSIGYKVIKRMSIGLGPDFQKMLVDNRPAPSTVERGTIQVAPTFDVGFIGKSEYALTKNVRAAVYYRKGVNNVITPMGKYIDRDYLQFQVKYTIFNK